MVGHVRKVQGKGLASGIAPRTRCKFTDHILGDKVANLKLPSVSGIYSSYERPSWQVVVNYELKLRTEAFKLVVDEGRKLFDALQSVTKGAPLKEAYFSAPLALRTASVKYRKGGNKGKGKTGQAEIPPPPNVPGAWQRPKKKGKGKGKRNGSRPSRQMDVRSVLRTTTARVAPMLAAPECMSAEWLGVSRIIWCPSVRTHSRCHRSERQGQPTGEIQHMSGVPEGVAGDACACGCRRCAGMVYEDFRLFLLSPYRCTLPSPHRYGSRTQPDSKSTPTDGYVVSGAARTVAGSSLLYAHGPVV